MPEGADLEDVLFRRGIHPLRSNAHPDPFYVPVVPRTVPSPVQLQTLPITEDHRVDQESEVEVDTSSSASSFIGDYCNGDFMRDYYGTHPDSD